MKRIGRIKGVGGQVTLEVGFALAAAFTLLLGAAIVFSYLNSRVVRRQEAYEQTRVTEEQVDEEALPELDFMAGD